MRWTSSNFNEFTNQIDFAQFGKAFNTHVDKTVTVEAGPQRVLVGKTVKALGRLSGRQAGRAAARRCRLTHRTGAAMTDEVVLRLEDVTKVYSGTVALKQASFDVRTGAVNVLVGENGAGKSTLMKIIAGVEQPTLGRILLDGEAVDFRSPADAEARGIGMVFQELNLLGNLTRGREHLHRRAR